MDVKAGKLGYNWSETKTSTILNKFEKENELNGKINLSKILIQ